MADTETTRAVTIQMTYTGTEFTRKYKMSGITTDVLSNLDSKITNFNASLEAGTAGSLSSVFISDDFDPESNIGYLKGIDQAVVQVTETTPIEW